MDALYLAKESWDTVSQETIVNCFRKAGFSEPGVDVCEEDNALADVPTPPSMTAEEFANFITMGNDLEIAGELSDAELLETATKKRCIEEESDSDHEPEPQNLTEDENGGMNEVHVRF